MVSRLSALCCSAALGLAVPCVANAEPPAEAEAEAESARTPDESGEPDAATEDPPAEADDEGLTEDDDDDNSEDLDPGSAEDDLDPPDTLALPDRLPRLQRIGWYHVLGAFTLGTTAGLLAGLAERQEDRATRIASGYDYESGSAVLYSDRKEEYERILDRGRAFETSAIVVGAVAGATAIAAITLFAVDARRKAPSSTARRTRLGPGAVEVRF